MLVDILTDLEKEAIDAVIAVKLNPPKMRGAEFDVLNGIEPTKLIEYVRSSISAQICRVAKTLKRPLENLIGQSVVFKFIPFARGSTKAEQVTSKRGRDEQFAANAIDFVLTRKIPAIQSPSQEAPSFTKQQSRK